MSAAAPFEERAGRAETLARTTAVAAEPLRFAAALFRCQALMATALLARHRDEALSGAARRDLPRLLDLMPGFLDMAAGKGPPELAEMAEGRKRDGRETALSRLLVYWEGGPESREDYLSRAFLRPWGEVLARLGISPDRRHRDGHCPFCGGAPIVAYRKAEPEAQGAARHLICALCGTDWIFARVRCPACLEEDPTKLPSFRSPQHSAVRIEACEVCRRYLKSLDLTLDARPIPEVDDLVSIAMDLWAVEQGYSRIEPGWAGL